MRDVTQQNGTLLCDRWHTDNYIHTNADIFIYWYIYQAGYLCCWCLKRSRVRYGYSNNASSANATYTSRTQMYMTQINGGIYIPNDKRCIPARFITGGWRLFHHSDITCVLKHFIGPSLGCLFNDLTRLTTKHHQCPELLVLCSGNRWYLWIDDFITWYLINTCMCN